MIYIGQAPWLQTVETLNVFNHLLDDSIGYLNYTEYHNTLKLTAYSLPQAIADNPSIRTLLVDASVDPWDPLYVLDDLNKLNLPVKIVTLTSNYEYDKLDAENIFFLPLFLVIIGQNRYYGPSTSRKYLANCLNRVGKPFRAVNLIELYKRPWSKDCYATFHDYQYTPKSNLWEGELTTEELAEFKKFKIPMCYDSTELTGMQQHQINIPAYYDSYLSIVTESTVNFPFISEKVAKPILAEQLFTVVGAAGCVQQIHQLGFDMCYDFIDHNHYDFEPDWRLRIKKMYEVLDPIMSFDIMEKATATLSPRLKANAAYLKSDGLVNRFVEPIIKKLLCYT